MWCCEGGSAEGRKGNVLGYSGTREGQGKGKPQANGTRLERGQVVVQRVWPGRSTEGVERVLAAA